MRKGRGRNSGIGTTSTACATLDAIRAEIRHDMAEAAGFVAQRNKATTDYDQGLLDGFALSLAIIDRHMKAPAPE